MYLPHLKTITIVTKMDLQRILCPFYLYVQQERKIEIFIEKRNKYLSVLIHTITAK